MQCAGNIIYLTLNSTIMNPLTLSGVGGSSNWLPLILPLAAIVALLKLGEYLYRYIKKRKLTKEHPLINEQEPSTDNQESGSH
jgi:hypothetical protein